MITYTLINRSSEPAIIEIDAVKQTVESENKLLTWEVIESPYVIELSPEGIKPGFLGGLLVTENIIASLMNKEIVNELKQYFEERFKNITPDVSDFISASIYFSEISKNWMYHEGILCQKITLDFSEQKIDLLPKNYMAPHQFQNNIVQIPIRQKAENLVITTTINPHRTVTIALT